MEKRGARISREMRFAMDNPDWYLTKGVYDDEERRRVRKERAAAPSPGFLPRGHPTGYGGVAEWPFSWHKALTDTRYRTAVRRTLDDTRYSPEYREAARSKLRRLLDYAIDIQLQLESAREDLLLEEAYEALTQMNQDQ